MNILHITTELGCGGIERLICDLSKMHIQRGHNVRVLTICKRGELEQELLQIGVNVDCYGAWGNWKRRAICFCWWLRDYLRRHKIDGVIEHCSADGYVSWICALVGVRYMVSVIHNTYPFRFCRRIEYRLQHKIFLKRYSHFVAVSKSVSEFEVRNFGIPRSRIRTIANGIVIDRFQLSAPTPEEKKQFLGIPLKENDLIVSSIGNLRTQKNHKLMLKAWALLLTECSVPLKLIIVGGGSLREALEKQCDSLGLRESVFFLGTCTDVPAVLKCCDIFAMSSKHEGQGIAALEAMASGLPVVATNVAGLRDVVQDGINGFLVEPDNPEALAEGLKELIFDVNLRHSIGQAGRRLVEKEFSIQRCAELHEKSLLESPLAK